MLIIILSAVETCVHWQIHPRQYNTDQPTRQEQYAGKCYQIKVGRNNRCQLPDIHRPAKQNPCQAHVKIDMVSFLPSFTSDMFFLLPKLHDIENTNCPIR